MVLRLHPAPRLQSVPIRVTLPVSIIVPLSLLRPGKLPQASIMWTPYARLRRDEIHQSTRELRHPRPAPINPPEPVSRDRSDLMVALLLSDFHYADLIRWLRKEYNAHAIEDSHSPSQPPSRMQLSSRWAYDLAWLGGRRNACLRRILPQYRPGSPRHGH
jgi:hypothetical protein